MRRMGPICSSPNRRPPSLAWICRRMPGRLMPRCSGDLRNGASCWRPVPWPMCWTNCWGCSSSTRMTSAALRRWRSCARCSPSRWAGPAMMAPCRCARVQRTKDMSAQPDKDKKPEGNPVVLLTAHGAKGLEWDEVWLLGAEEGRFPDEASSIQEERRLFYVAMTRARTTLIISAAGKAAISPFVHEAGVERIGEGADVVALP
ncbi:ATP-dependent helicase [Verminephrobacter eiseniae]|nr:hypothetical protein ET532_022605 [Verminephrobacter sp. Larva24]MCW5233525.1 ATP-dependent helicase [Verminephrobacter eiseniae]MCW5294920.1 ATP-dependent helicase [Verminephrobacter eiseniae]MCW8183801.1 ATP-dependent helicase [Verminephrobacter eiseniae]MCW8222345.1 ATP-dependent helicase [Verminephrobacter eiseniae]